MSQAERWILSGGLASGKSHVRDRLSSLGVFVVDADSIGHEVLEPDGPGFGPVSTKWPEAVRSGAIDRSTLGSIVFTDQDELRQLEAITHPLIFGRIQQLVQGIDGLVVVELPLLKDLGPSWSRIVVDVESTTQLERALSRGMERSDVNARLALQPSREEWLAAADLVVPNHGELDQLDQTIGLLHRVLTS